MTCYAYFHIDKQDENLIFEYALNKKLTIDTIILEYESIKSYWIHREIGRIINTLKTKDILIISDATQLACSVSQVLEILSKIYKNKAKIYFVKYNICIDNIQRYIDIQLFLTLISKIESDFISKRTSQALAKRKETGMPLGRPKGSKNKNLKLDIKNNDIKKYLNLGISKASIAKLVGCHPQTLYNWLKRKKLLKIKKLKS